MKLRIWTLAAALVIIIAFGLALPTLLSDKTVEIAVNYEQVKADFRSELIESLAALHYTGDQATELSTTEPGASAAPETPETPEITENPPKSTSPINPASPDNQAIATPTEITEGDTPLGGGSSLFVKDGWINEKINLNRDKIGDADLSRGSDIYNRLDTDFIFGLADGGLTDEERVQVDDYLKSQLGGGDYALAKNLYFKYVGLLNND